MLVAGPEKDVGAMALDHKPSLSLSVNYLVFLSSSPFPVQLKLIKKTDLFRKAFRPSVLDILAGLSLPYIPVTNPKLLAPTGRLFPLATLKKVLTLHTPSRRKSGNLLQLHQKPRKKDVNGPFLGTNS